MKRKFILGILGSGIVALSSFGQGVLFFGNYGNSGPISGSAIFYGSNTPTSNVPAGHAGMLIGSDFTAELLYLNGAAYSPMPSSETIFLGTDGVPGSDAGFTTPGTVVDIPGTSSAGGTTVHLKWEAFNNVAIDGFAADTITGMSAPFTAITSANASHPADDFSAGYGTVGFAGFTVQAVPEPATMALIGLGAAGLLAMRRRKA